MFQLFSLLLAAYVSWRLVLPLKLPGQWLLIAALLIVSQHHRIIASFWGSRASPEIPGWLIMILGALYGALLLGSCLALLLDLSGLLLKPLRADLAQVLLHARTPRLGLALLAISLAAYGVWQAVRVPAVKTVHVTLQNLPPELDGFRIVQLTDLHASRLLQHNWIQSVVQKTNALQADVVVLTGDLQDGTVANRHHDVAPLKALQAKHGVYAIVGNHEYYAEYQAWLDKLRELGLQLLLNEHRLIGTAPAQFALAGITDATARSRQQAAPDVHAAVQGIPASMPIVLLSHRPTDAEQNAAAGVDLQLSGHTHGGQILGLHKIVQMANQGFVSGFYPLKNMLLYVSNGTGLWAGFPLRLGVPSEITEITLHRPQQEHE